MFRLSTDRFFGGCSGFRLQASRYSQRLLVAMIPHCRGSVLFVACSLWFATLSASSNAQDTLSLARAIEIGLSNNFGVQIEKLNVEVAVRNNTWGMAGRLPTVTMAAGQNNSAIQRKPANPFAVAGLNISDNVQGQLDVQFTLFDGFGVRMAKRRLDQLETLSKGNSTFIMESTIQSIILSYYQAVLEQERLQVFIKNREFSEERYNYVKLKKNLGSAISFDVLQEQNNYLTDSANVLLQEIVVRNSQRNLNVLLNQNINASYALTNPLEIESEEYRYEDLRDKMFSSNTNLRNQYVSQELTRNATRTAQSNLYPTLLLNVGGTGSLDQLTANFRSATGNTIENTVGYVNRDLSQPVYLTVNETAFTQQTQTGNSYGAYANLSLRYTLFNGSQLRRAVDNAQIQEKIAQLTTDQLKATLENSLLAGHDLYNLRKQLVQIAIIKLQAAELNLNLANERYKNGALSAIDLRIVQENYRAAALEKFAAIYAGLSSKLDLVRLTGGLVDRFPAK